MYLVFNSRVLTTPVIFHELSVNCRGRLAERLLLVKSAGSNCMRQHCYTNLQCTCTPSWC